MIVMGTRGPNGAQRWLLGSVSSRAVQHAPCNVLVVR
jgi:nucleotide-binding universal stress UspA family protein